MFFNNRPPGYQQQQQQSPFVEDPNEVANVGQHQPGEDPFDVGTSGISQSNEYEGGQAEATEDDVYSAEIGESSQESVDTDYSSQYSPYTVSSMLGHTQLKELQAPQQPVDIALATAAVPKENVLFGGDRKPGERGLSEKLCYNTGTMYGLGLATGGAWGLAEGLRNPAGETFKLRLNSILNNCTRRGPLVGNSVGVMTMFYTTLAHGFQKLRNEDEDDIYNHVGAGALAGIVFKSTSGAKQALKTGVMFGGMVAAVGGALHLYNRFSNDDEYHYN